MKEVKEFTQKVFASLSPIIQQRLTLALFAASISDFKLKLTLEGKVINKLKPYDIAELLEFCVSNYPETKKILTNAEENYYFPLFAQLDELPQDERLQVVAALEQIGAFLKSTLANLPREELLIPVCMFDKILSQKKILMMGDEEKNISKILLDKLNEPNKIFNNPYPINFFNNKNSDIGGFMYEKLNSELLLAPKNLFFLSNKSPSKFDLLQPETYDLYKEFSNEKLIGNKKINYLEEIFKNEIKYLSKRLTKATTSNVASTAARVLEGVDVIDPNTIVVMTEVVYKTLGDFYAAKRLIAAIKQKSPNLRVVWLIMEQDKAIPLEELRSDETHLFSAWGELLDALQVRVVYQAALVVMFPTFHFLSDVQFKKINDMREKKMLRPVVNILEYDYVDSSVGAQTALRTGFGSNALGVFLEEPLTETDEALADTVRSHKELAGLFSYQTLAEYRHTHVCYFGYRNKELVRSNNKLDSYYFIRAVVALQAAKNNTKNIDIIVPVQKEELERLQEAASLEFFRNKGIAVIHVIGQRKIAVPGANYPGLAVCVYSCFPLPNKVFKAAMHLAEKDLVMCTGDQSISDVLVVPGAIPLYQVMVWKKELYVQFCKIAQEACGHCELTRYLEMLKTPTDPEVVARYIATHGSKMQQQMLQLQEYLRTHKNLFNNLPQQLITIVDELKLRLGKADTSTQKAVFEAN